MAVELSKGVTLQKPGDDESFFEGRESILFRVARQGGQLGAAELDLAHVVWACVLRDRDDVNGGIALRHFPFPGGSLPPVLRDNPT